MKKNPPHESGFTLLELLLYVALYSFVFILIVSMYSQIFVVAEKMQKQIRKTEVILYAEIMVYSNMYLHLAQREEYIEYMRTGMSRILRYYPEFNLIELSVIDTDNYSNTTTLQSHSFNIKLIFNTFSHVVHVDLI